VNFWPGPAGAWFADGIGTAGGADAQPAMTNARTKTITKQERAFIE
jgi:hypothetical protein